MTAPDQVLQLTNFRRGDTGGNVVTDGRRVFFMASANPFGTNPSENCQIFSISVLGDDLRQLTQFRAADHSAIGCATVSQQPGCIIYPYELWFDPETDTLIFPSTCDPVGANPNGGKQYFAMRPEGTGLRQVTATRGAVTGADGSVDVELPGPYGYDGF